jgi:hypothetical protein
MPGLSPSVDLNTLMHAQEHGRAVSDGSHLDEVIVQTLVLNAPRAPAIAGNIEATDIAAQVDRLGVARIASDGLNPAPAARADVCPREVGTSRRGQVTAAREDTDGDQEGDALHVVTFNNEDLEERSGHSGFDQFACCPIIVSPQFVGKRPCDRGTPRTTNVRTDRLPLYVDRR